MPRRSRSRSPRRRRSRSPPPRRRSDHDRHHEREREKERRNVSPPRRRSYHDDRERERERVPRREGRSPELKRDRESSDQNAVHQHPRHVRERNDFDDHSMGSRRVSGGRGGRGGGDDRGRRVEGGRERRQLEARGGGGGGGGGGGRRGNDWREKVNEIHPSRMTDLSMDVEISRGGGEKRMGQSRSERFGKAEDSVFVETELKKPENNVERMESEGRRRGGGEGREGERGVDQREFQERRLLESLTDPQDVPRGTWYYEHDDRGVGTGPVRKLRGPPSRRYSTGDEIYRRERGWNRERDVEREREREWDKGREGERGRWRGRGGGGEGERRWSERRERSPRVWRHDIFDELQGEEKEKEMEGEELEEGPGGKWRSVVQRPREERRSRRRVGEGVDGKWVHDKFEEQENLVTSEECGEWRGRGGEEGRGGRDGGRERREDEQAMDTR